MKLPYEVHDGVGPYALLVHGMLSSRSYWGANLASLSSVCRPVVVELWGHGGAPTPDGPDEFTPEGYGEAFDEIRRDLGVETWVIVGHSLGAALTLRYAISRPERVLGQVFMNSNSAFADEQWSASVSERAATNAAAIELAGREGLARHALHPARITHVDPDVRDALVREFGEHDPTGIARTYRYTLPGSPVRNLLPRNRVPSLFVVGRRETRFDAARRHVEAVMPMLQVTEADAGHPVNLQDPTTFNGAVTRFVTGLAHQ